MIKYPETGIFLTNFWKGIRLRKQTLLVMANKKMKECYEKIVSIRSRLKIVNMHVCIAEMIESCFDLMEEYCNLSEEERADNINWIYCCNAAGTLSYVSRPGLAERIAQFIEKYPFLKRNKIAGALQLNMSIQNICYS